ncbi:hypothetical protein COCNU_scaffold000148G000050 [Cocos nucifera]|nr:hypothetical protein [Cocos nucifera]
MVADSDGPPFRVSTVLRSGTSIRGGKGEAAAVFDGPHSTIHRLEAEDYAMGQAMAEGRGDERLRRRWAPRMGGRQWRWRLERLEEDGRPQA